MSIFWEMTSGGFPYSTLVGSTVVTYCVSVRRLLGDFLLREGGLGPYVSLCNDRFPWSLGVPPSSSTTVYGWVLLFLTHFAQCWLSRCVPLIVGRPKDFHCGGDSTGAVLDEVMVTATGAVVQMV